MSLGYEAWRGCFNGGKERGREREGGSTKLKEEKGREVELWGHIISSRGIEVDPAKIVVISQLPYPSCVREVRSFLGHAGFYKRFIKDFSKVALPLSNLLQMEVEFDFDDRCEEVFDRLKRALTTTPIIQAPDWTAPFELMCDVSNYALGAVPAQKIDKLPSGDLLCFQNFGCYPSKLHYHIKGATSDSFCSWKILFIFAWFSCHCLYWPCSSEVLVEKGLIKASIDQVDALPPRVWFRDPWSEWCTKISSWPPE